MLRKVDLFGQVVPTSNVPPLFELHAVHLGCRARRWDKRVFRSLRLSQRLDAAYWKPGPVLDVSLALRLFQTHARHVGFCGSVFR